MNKVSAKTHKLDNDQKNIQLKSGHNLVPAHKSKYDPATPSNCVTCELHFNENHLLFECKSLELFQTNLKTMITNTLSFHCHNFPRISVELLLGEGDTSLEAVFYLFIYLFTYFSFCIILSRYGKRKRKKVCIQFHC